MKRFNLKKDVKNIISCGIDAVDSERLVLDPVKVSRDYISIKGKKYSLSGKKVFVIGFGKCAGYMARALEKKLGAKISSGIVITNNLVKLKKIKNYLATHPLPSRKNVSATNKLMNLKIGKDDLIFAVVSGGGSSMLTLPDEGLKLSDLKKVSKLLINSGASINEVNIVRKCLSKVKGGKLAEHFAPSKIISLILSDVPSNDLGVVASGPTIENTSNIKDVSRILKKYNLLKKLPFRVKKFLKNYSNNSEKINSDNFLIGSNKNGLIAMKNKAKELGYFCKISNLPLTGESSLIAKEKINEILSIKVKKPTAYIFVGETNVSVGSFKGKGGRNQEYVLSSLINASKTKNKWIVASVNSDGDDFIEGISGAFADYSVIKNGSLKKSLEKHDSYNALKKLNLHLKFKSKTNVSDFVVYLVLPETFIN